jgi:hypothetical protein
MAIGASVGVLILWLVRRNHLHGGYALWWLAMAATVTLLGSWPQLFDIVAAELGVNYPPILALVLGFSLVLVKLLTMDVARSRQERKIRRLAQRLAMLEAGGKEEQKSDHD